MNKTKNILKGVFLITSFFILLLSYSQEEAYFWHFGEYAGLDFSSGDPVALENSAINTKEGCSSISSSDGELLFYTDGSTVWNRNNEVMPNGTGLMGHSSSTQSGIIVPVPNNPILYYLFTVEAIDGEDDGFRYSVIDMNLDNGLGDITEQKNILLEDFVFEKVTAVANSTNNGVWILCCKLFTNDIYAYHLDHFGLNETAVISSVGDTIGGYIGDPKGYMVVSPDGTKLVKANVGDRNVEFFDFDNSSGIVSNAFKDTNFVNEQPYGVAFSPNSKILYISTWKSWGSLFQYNLAAGSPEQIINSRIKLENFSPLYVGALQLAADNKIYIARPNLDFLGVINQPNVYGTACGYEVSGVYLDDKLCWWGLPPFVQSFFSQTITFNYDPACFGYPTQFYQNCSTTPDSVFWDFGDPPSGSSNYSNELNPVHEFSSWGLFKVKFNAWFEGEKDSVSKFVSVNNIPEINLGIDTSICNGDSIILDAGSGYYQYQWHNGDTSQFFKVITDGTFWVKVTNNDLCCNYDTININTHPVSNIINDTTICDGDSIYFGGEYYSNPGTYYDSLVNTFGCDSIITCNLSVNDVSEVSQQIIICDGDSVFAGGAWQKEAGTYYDLYQNSEGCDSTVITFLDIEDILYSYENIQICEGDSVMIGEKYYFTPGSYSDTLISIAGCDSIHIVDLEVNQVHSFFNDTTICSTDSIYVGGDFQSTPGIYYDNYLSHLGCDSTYITSLSIANFFSQIIDTNICDGDSVLIGENYEYEPGTYYYEYKTISGCDSLVTTNLTITPLPSVSLGNDTSLFDGDQLLLNVSFPDAKYLWNDSSTSSKLMISSEGTYYVTLSNKCGSVSDTINVYYLPGFSPETACSIYAPDGFTPNGDNLNDIFKIVSECDFKAYKLIIYDRWGKQIFETQEINKGWNGKINGRNAPTGSYVWILKYKIVNPNSIQDKNIYGVVTLLR